jgi:hypothetical protein
MPFFGGDNETKQPCLVGGDYCGSLVDGGFLGRDGGDETCLTGRGFTGVSQCLYLASSLGGQLRGLGISS